MAAESAQLVAGRLLRMALATTPAFANAVLRRVTETTGAVVPDALTVGELLSQESQTEADLALLRAMVEVLGHH